MKNRKHCIFKYIFYIILAAMLVFFDQYTKYLAAIKLKNNPPFRLISGIIELRYLENDGMAWGMLGGKIQLFTIFTFILMILMCVLIVRIDIMKEKADRPRTLMILQIIVVILVAGAIGNLIDRIRLGYVIDFIYFKLINFPIFNVADCYVVISTFGLLLMIMFFVNEHDWSLLLSGNKGNKRSG